MIMCYTVESILKMSIQYWRGDYMAEFCLECWNKIMDTKDSKRKFVMTRDLELCEECNCCDKTTLFA